MLNPSSSLTKLFSARVRPGRVIWVGLRPARREPMQAMFALDVTAAQVECEACDCLSTIGALRLYAAPMGEVLRCVRCDVVLVRTVRTPHGQWLEMRGVRRVRFRPSRD